MKIKPSNTHNENDMKDVLTVCGVYKNIHTKKYSTVCHYYCHFEQTKLHLYHHCKILVLFFNSPEHIVLTCDMKIPGSLAPKGVHA